MPCLPQINCRLTIKLEIMESLPIVDLRSWTVDPLPTSRCSLTAEQLQTALEWDKVLQSDGFAVLLNHGLEESIFETVNRDAKCFFDKSMEEKLPFSRGTYGHPDGGYTPVGRETVALSVLAEDKGHKVALNESEKPKHDPVESFAFTADPDRFVHPLTGEISNPIRSTGQYFRSMEMILQRLHRLSAAALGLEDLMFFERFYDESLQENAGKGKNGNALRLAYYPASPDRDIDDTSTELLQENALRYGAHTDYQGFTILRPDKRDWHTVTASYRGADATCNCGGLEVYLRTLEMWKSVKVDPSLNVLVVNVGDLMQRWTNDRWHSPLHRVVSPANQSNMPVPRQAIVFFSGPLSDVEVSPLAVSQTALIPTVDAEAPRYPPIRSGEHLLLKIARSNT